MNFVHTYGPPIGQVLNGESAESVLTELLRRLNEQLTETFKDRAAPSADFGSWSIELSLAHKGLDSRATHYSISIVLQLAPAQGAAMSVRPKISIDSELREEGSTLRWVPPDPDPNIPKLLEEITNALG